MSTSQPGASYVQPKRVPMAYLTSLASEKRLARGRATLARSSAPRANRAREQTSSCLTAFSSIARCTRHCGEQIGNTCSARLQPQLGTSASAASIRDWSTPNITLLATHASKVDRLGVILPRLAGMRERAHKQLSHPRQRSPCSTPVHAKWPRAGVARRQRRRARLVIDCSPYASRCGVPRS